MVEGRHELAEDAGVGKAFDLSGQVAVLTGAASGIGRSSAYVLSSAGAAVILGDINGPGVVETAKEVERRGGKAEAVEMDVTRRADVEALVERAVSDYGKIDVMGNIAGVPSYGPVVDVTDEELDRVLDINLRGVFYGCRAAMRSDDPPGFRQYRQRRIGHRGQWRRPELGHLRHDQGRRGQPDQNRRR